MGKYEGGGVVIMLEQFSFLKNWNTEKFQSEEKQEGGEEFLYIPKIKMVWMPRESQRRGLSKAGRGCPL